LIIQFKDTHCGQQFHTMIRGNNSMLYEAQYLMKCVVFSIYGKSILCNLSFSIGQDPVTDKCKL